MEFVPFEPDIEVNGRTVHAIVDGFSEFQQLASKYLLAQGIGTRGPAGVVQIDPAAWYPQGAWLRAFQKIAMEVGDPVLYRIGLAIPKNAKFPSSPTDIESAVRSIDIAYHMNHRKAGRELFDAATGTMLEGIGHYGCTRVAGRNAIVAVCNDPYPCEFDRGIIAAMAQRFQPTAKVAHEAATPCRKNGAESCSYLVTWNP